MWLDEPEVAPEKAKNQDNKSSNTKSNKFVSSSVGFIQELSASESCPSWYTEYLQDV